MTYNVDKRLVTDKGTFHAMKEILFGNLLNNKHVNK